MSDSSRLSEKAQGLHLLGHSTAHSSNKPSLRSAATAAAAAYAWRKASKSKDGSGNRSGLTVVPSRPSTEGFMAMATANGNPSPPALGRRVSTSAVALTHQLSFGSRDADSNPDIAVDSRSVLNEARAKLATVEKKTVDQWRRVAAEAKALSKVEKGEERILQLEHQLSRMEDELRDAALIEVALYSVVAEHGSSAHKVHTPARRLARFYKYAFKNWGLERRAAIANNIVSGLVLVSRACGSDVPRLTFWWSNVVVLRETISHSCEDSDVGSSSVDEDTDSSLGNDFQARAFRSQRLRKSKSDVSYLLSSQGASKDWRTSGMLVSSLLRIESWLHARVLESVWWQAMTPRMQLGGTSTINAKGSAADLNGDLSKFSGDSRDFAKDTVNYNSRKLGDTRQGNISVEIWKRAFTDALKRLCPLQGQGLECGCLPALNRMVIEECVVRLDVAMFNGILRDPEDDAPTDPLADPITDLSVLPIPIGSLTFGAGSHLKNVVVNWSTWLSALVSCKDRVPAESKSSLPADSEDEEPVQFNLLKATGDLLMLPKDILLDAEIRKEVCPGLNLPLIRRVLANFGPDVFSPDPISPGLLNALATEVANERRKFGEDDISPDDIAMACVPPVLYSPPPTSFVKLWIGEPANSIQWGRSPSSALRKGYTSDDELEEYENPLSLLQDKPRYGAENGSGKKKRNEGLGASRFQLLKEVWVNP